MAQGKQTTVDSTEVQFFDRITSIPLVKDSVATAQSYANSNKYSRAALETAGSAVATVQKYTEPYQSRLQPAIAKVDQLGCKSLDLLTETFPIVKQPTDEIIGIVKQPIEQTVVVYTNVKSSIDATIDARVTVPATNIAKNVNERVTPLVNNVEAVLNKYLPADQTERSINESNQAVRVVAISQSAGRRIGKRISVQLANHNIPQSKEDLIRLKETNALLSQATDTIASVHQKIHELTSAAFGELDKEIPHKIQELSASLLAEIDSVSVYVKTHAKQFPEYVQDRLSPMIQFFNERYQVILVEVHKPDVSPVQKAKNIIQVTSDETLPLLYKSANDLRDAITSYTASLNSNVNEVTSKVKATLVRAQ